MQAFYRVALSQGFSPSGCPCPWVVESFQNMGECVIMRVGPLLAGTRCMKLLSLASWIFLL